MQSCVAHKLNAFKKGVTAAHVRVLRAQSMLYDVFYAAKYPLNCGRRVIRNNNK